MCEQASVSDIEVCKENPTAALSKDGAIKQEAELFSNKASRKVFI